MEPLSPKSLIASFDRKHLALALLAGCLVLTGPGCVTSDWLVRHDAPAPVEEVTTVVTAWNPGIVSPPDPVNRGEPLPGVAGRVYLFGEGRLIPVVGDGTIAVDLFSEMPGAPKTPLEEFRFNKDALKLLLKRDAVGWGYTLFLPWGGDKGTYKPDITRIRLRVRYERPNKLPLYSDSGPIALQKPGDGVVRTSSFQRVMTPKGQ
jgi:hypothetical protein